MQKRVNKIEFITAQQDRERHSLCVSSILRDNFYVEVVKKMKSQINFFIKQGIHRVTITQSAISESCYIELYMDGSQHIYIRCRFSEHNNKDDYFSSHIENRKNYFDCSQIKNILHFNKVNMYILRKIAKNLNNEQMEVNNKISVVVKKPMERRKSALINYN